MRFQVICVVVDVWGKVFVGHTSELADYPPGRSFVQAALDAVRKAQGWPVDMTYFAAREGNPAEYCEQQVRECDVYVGLIGMRYGSLVPGRDDEVSYTELEFWTATDTGIPRLVFLLDEDAVPPGRADKNKAKIQAFRDRLRKAGIIVKTVRSSDGVDGAVYQALIEIKEDLHRKRALRDPATSAKRAGAPLTALPMVGDVGPRLGQVRRQLSDVFKYLWPVDQPEAGPTEPDRPEHVTFKERGLGRALTLFLLATLIVSLGVAFVSVRASHHEDAFGIFLTFLALGLLIISLLLFPAWVVFDREYLIFDEYGIQLKQRWGPKFTVRWSEIRTVRVWRGMLLLTLRSVNPHPIPGLHSRKKPPCYDSWVGGVTFCRLDRFTGASTSVVEDVLRVYAGKAWVDRRKA